jgi:hypothetical protein
MRFKDFLIEKAMNSATYVDIAKRYGDTALVGFEFEMLVPEDTVHYYRDDPLMSTDSVRVDSLKTLDKILEYFDQSAGDERAMTRDFNIYISELRNNYIADHMDDYLDPDENNEDHAEDMAGKDFDKNDSTTLDDWIKAVYDDAEGFVNEYDLEPKYGYDENSTAARVYTELPEADNDDDKNQTFLNVISSFNKRFNIKPRFANGTKTTNKSLDQWYVEEDTSIEGDGFGVELVTPPLPLTKAVEHLKEVATWMRLNDFETNSSTGLHINISIPDLKEKIDPLKLVLFMGERYVANQFDRLTNTFAKQHIDYILKAIGNEGKLPKNEKEMLHSSWSILSTGKYHTVNLGKIEQGYLEFRVTGGKDYNSQSSIETVIETIMRFVAVVEIACDTNLERKEYLKKASAIFSKANDKLANTPIDKNSSIPVELTRIYNYFKSVDGVDRFYQDWTQYERFPEGGTGKAELLLDIINGSRNVLHKMNKTMEPKERVFFKMEAKKVGLTTKMIDDFFGNEIENRADFKKMTGQ